MHEVTFASCFMSNPFFWVFKLHVRVQRGFNINFSKEMDSIDSLVLLPYFKLRSFLKKWIRLWDTFSRLPSSGVINSRKFLSQKKSLISWNLANERTAWDLSSLFEIASQNRLRILCCNWFCFQNVFTEMNRNANKRNIIT